MFWFRVHGAGSSKKRMPGIFVGFAIDWKIQQMIQTLNI